MTTMPAPGTQTMLRGSKLRRNTCYCGTAAAVLVHSLARTSPTTARLVLADRLVGLSTTRTVGPTVANVYVVTDWIGGTAPGTWVIEYRNRLYIRLSTSLGGKSTIIGGRWSTVVKFAGAVLPNGLPTNPDIARLMVSGCEDDLPILADALEEAGCADQELLADLRR